MAHPFINIESQPADPIVSSYYCVDYLLRVTNFVLDQSGYPRATITFIGIPTAGQYITIFGLTFSFTAGANDNGRKIVIGGTAAANCTNTYNSFLLNYELQKYYDIELIDPQTLRLTAKNKGSQYNTNFDSNANGVGVTEVTYTDINTDSTYKVVGSVQRLVDGVWVLVDEIVRDVTPRTQTDGTIYGEVKFRLDFVKALYRAMRPDLDNNSPYQDFDGAPILRIAITDFKGTVSTSGFYTELDAICLLMGGYDYIDSDVRLQLYYDIDTETNFTRLLNIMPKQQFLCCDNHLFVALLVEDAEEEGWNARVIGEINFANGTQFSNFTFQTLTGTGSALVILPMGPGQLGVCSDDYQGESSVINYAFQGMIMRGVSLLQNLFVDGDNGTFEANINGMVGYTDGINSIILTKSPTFSHTGGFSLKLDNFGNVTGLVNGSTVVKGNTPINFVAGNFYEAQAWILLPNSFNCGCLSNLFVDGDFGTFETNLNDITTPPATSRVILPGYIGNAMMVNGWFNLAALPFHGNALMRGNTAINFLAGIDYEITGYVKIAGFDCRAFSNLFIDADFGSFEGVPATMVAQVQYPAGLSASIDEGYLGSGSGLLLENFHLATIISGDYLVNGTSLIFFEAGKTYYLTGKIKANVFDVCACIGGNLFIDGDYGTFETNLDDIATEFSNVVIDYSLLPGGVIGNYLDMVLRSGTISNTQSIIFGDTTIVLTLATIYRAEAWVRVDRLDFNAYLTNLFTDGDNGSFTTGAANISTDADNVITLARNATYDYLEVGVEYLSPALGSMIVYGDTTINLSASTDYNFYARLKVNGLSTTTPDEIIIQLAIQSGFTDASLSNIKVWSTVLDNEDEWYLLEAVLTTGLVTSGKIGVGLAGTDVNLANLVDVIIDGITLADASIPYSALELSIGAKNPAAVDVITLPITSQQFYPQGGFTWVKLEADVKYNGLNPSEIAQIGIIVTSGAAGIVGNTHFGFDQIKLYELGSGLEMNIDVAGGIGVNGTAVHNVIVDYSNNCTGLDNQWLPLQTTLTVTNSFYASVGVFVEGNVPCILDPSFNFRADDIVVSSASPQFMRFQFGLKDLAGVSITNPDANIIINQDLLISGGICANVNQWVPIKTTVRALQNFTARVNLEIDGSVSAFKTIDQLWIDQIILSDGTESELEFYIDLDNSPTVVTNHIETYKVQDQCGNFQNWVRVLSAFYASTNFADRLGIKTNGNLGCLSVSSQGPIYIDDIKLICFNGVGALLSEEYDIEIVGEECDCCDESCCNEEFIYRNQLGVFDSLHLQCLNEEEISVRFDEVIPCDDCGNDFKFGNGGKIMTNVVSEVKHKIVSELTADYREMLKQFVKSNERYVIVKGEYVPIIPITDSIKVYNKIDDKNKLVIQFEYKFGIDEITLVQ